MLKYHKWIPVRKEIKTGQEFFDLGCAETKKAWAEKDMEKKDKRLGEVAQDYPVQRIAYVLLQEVEAPKE